MTVLAHEAFAGSRNKTWQLRMMVTAAAATVAVATVFGPASPIVTRLGAGEVVGFSTVTPADTIMSTAVLAEVAAAGVANRNKTPKTT